MSSLLTGCSAYKDVNIYYRPDTLVGLRCVNQCSFQRATCRRHCRQMDYTCMATAKVKAKPVFAAYLRSQSVRQQPITRTLDDFVDYSECHLSYTCERTYNSCFVECGGKITTKNVCIKNCSYNPGIGN